MNQVGKINGQLLYAHQHQDRASLAATAGLLSNLLVVLYFLPRFPRPETMAWAFLGGSIFSQILYWFFVRQTKCCATFPRTPTIHWSDFQPLWLWGRRFFLYSLLDNFAANLPTLLAGRFLTLEALGIWGVLQRIANMVSQGVLKIPQLAAPALMEMHARGEESQFRKRSQQILWTQNFLAGLALGAITSGGDFFLKVWLGKALPMDFWVLPIFTLALLADFDQRIRLSLDSIRLQMRRPTAAAFLKTFMLILAVPYLSHQYGLIGILVAQVIVCGLILLPMSLTGFFSRNSYVLPPQATLAGLGSYLLVALTIWLCRSI